MQLLEPNTVCVLEEVRIITSASAIISLIDIVHAVDLVETEISLAPRGHSRQPVACCIETWLNHGRNFRLNVGKEAHQTILDITMAENPGLFSSVATCRTSH